MKIDSFHSIIQRTLGALLVAATMATAGCIEDSDPCLPDKGDKEGLHLRFDIVTRGGVSSHSSQSRALVLPPNPQPGTVAENYLDIPNLTFLIFDENKQLLTPFYPRVEVDAGTDYQRYTVHAVIQDIYFDFPRQDPQPAPTDQVPFYILVLANYSNYQPLGLKAARGMSLQQFFGENSMSFAIPGGQDIWYPHPEALKNDPEAAKPLPGSLLPPQFIPMAGLQKFAPTVEEMMTGDESNYFMLDKDINMLRALAKIEVVDKIGIADDATLRPDNSPSVEKVEQLGYYSRGSLLPVWDQWNLPSEGPETQYVSTAFVPKSASYINPYPSPAQPDQLHDKAFRDFFEDKEATARRKDGCKVFSCYLPEYLLPGAPDNKAWIQVTITNHDLLDNKDQQSILYQLRLAEYPLPVTATGAVDENAVTYIPLLRNNIYRYEILSVATNVINLQWTVCPMDDDATVTIPPFN